MNCINTTSPCFPNPCKNGGTCIDLINDYNCTCKLMYSGRNCSGEFDTLASIIKLI